MRARTQAFYDGGRFLTNEDLSVAANSIFAATPNPHYTSKRFQHIPTSHMINVLKDANWHPVSVQQARIRKPEKDGYQRHMLRFRNPDLMKKVAVNEVIPELVMTNAHDGTSAYKIYAGLFRVLCLNGLIVSDAVFTAMTIKHFGFDDKDVLDATYRVIESTPLAINAVKEMKTIDLSQFKRIEFAEKAAALRFPNVEMPVNPADLLQARRAEDVGTDLWRTYNVIQENIMSGGILTNIENKNKLRLRTRALKNIRDVVRINRDLWETASHYGNIH